MATATQCDNCAEIIYGKKGTAYVTKPYLFIRGFFASYRTDNSPVGVIQTRITSEKQTELIFCDLKCLGLFIEQREKFWDSIREKNNDSKNDDEDDY